MTLFADLPARAAQHFKRTRRPWVTLTYAQSLDGSIALDRAGQLELSGDESRRMTHRLRALHSAILVGIGTVLADDPRLSARLVDPGAGVEGKSPQPVIVDTHLRLPIAARLLQNPDLLPWVMTSRVANNSSRRALEAAGARILEVPTLDSGLLDLDAMLDQLGGLGIVSLMVEGGSRIITSFLKWQLANVLIVTLAPALVGGLNAIDPTLWAETPSPRLTDVHSQQLGDDVILWGDLSIGQI